MKKFKYIACVLFALMISMTSCKDKLDLLPTNELETSIVLVSPSNFELFTKGIYGHLRDNYTSLYTILPDVMSDNLIIKQNGRKSLQTYYLLLTNSENTYGEIRTFSHRVIFSANTALENIDVLEDGEYKTNLTGELLALRALSHFDIAKTFAKTPSIGADSDLGIVYRTSTSVGDNDSRITLGETYTNIVADLEQAKSFLNDDNGLGRINKFTVYGLLSRVYLYMGNAEKARENAQYVVDNSPYEVTPMASVNDLWDNVYFGSTLLSSLVDVQDDIEMGVNYGQTGPTGTKSEYVPDFGFYNLYSDSDIRKTAYFETSSFEGNDYNHIIKYKQRPGAPANVADAPILRMEEVMLNLAEAQAQLGNDADALASLNMIRTRRYSDFNFVNQMGQDLKDAIQLERRLELAFEGHRFYDLKRQGLGFTRTNAGDLSDGSGTPPPASALSLSAGNFRYEFPYAQRSLNINPNLVQNPGY